MKRSRGVVIPTTIISDNICNNNVGCKETGKNELTSEHELRSEVQFVQELIQNNANERRPKKRMRPMELLNQAFYLLGQNAVIAENRENTVEDLFKLITEFAEKHHTLPKSNTIARVLYYWRTTQRSEMVDYAIQLVEELLKYQTLLPSAFASSFNERVITIVFRLLTSIERNSNKEFIERLLKELPSASFKRRLFNPLLEYAATHKDVNFALKLLKESEKRNVELWDEDYHLILVCIERMSEESASSCSKATNTVEDDWYKSQQQSTEILLEHLSRHHPVVGNKNAEILKSLLEAASCEIDLDGRCSNCLHYLEPFELKKEERVELLHQIDMKLIQSRLLNGSKFSAESISKSENIDEMESLSSHCSDNSSLSQLKKMEKPQTDSICVELENNKQMSYLPDKCSSKIACEHSSSAIIYAKNVALLEEMYYAIRTMEYDTVIDGANIGYYGLSGWYQSAKEEMLKKSGRCKESVTLSELTCIPIPVDVEPKFMLIESMRQTLVEMKKNPVIVLHVRHIHSAMSEEAKALFHKWKSDNALIVSPTFLNDDYCWLYASLQRPGTMIVTNDLMRDHHFNIFSPQLFIRWRQRHRITYRIKFNANTADTTILLSTPTPYSIWVQREKSDSQRNTSWHIPYMKSVSVIEQATNQPCNNNDSKTESDISTTEKITNSTTIDGFNNLNGSNTNDNITTCFTNKVSLAKDGDDECEIWLCSCKNNHHEQHLVEQADQNSDE